MRIISGKYKGHRLSEFNEPHIRPTSDRVKESWFSILGEQWENSRVLDLFSGTGNLGIEALSRGASWVQFVEMNPRSLKVLLKNIEHLKIPTEDYSISRKDVFAFLKKQKEPFDLILIDPPFTEQIAHYVMQTLSASQAYHGHTVIGIESSKKERIEVQYGKLVRQDQRAYGDKFLNFFKESL